MIYLDPGPTKGHCILRRRNKTTEYDCIDNLIRAGLITQEERAQAHDEGTDLAPVIDEDMTMAATNFEEYLAIWYFHGLILGVLYGRLDPPNDLKEYVARAWEKA